MTKPNTYNSSCTNDLKRRIKIFLVLSLVLFLGFNIGIVIFDKFHQDICPEIIEEDNLITINESGIYNCESMPCPCEEGDYEYKYCNLCFTLNCSVEKQQ